MATKREDFTRLTSVITRPEHPTHVRAMAVICFAAAGLSLAMNTAMPSETARLDPSNRALVSGMIAVVGLAYWIFASRFKVWMLHVAITLGILTGCAAVSGLDSPMRVAVAISTLLWTCVLIGAIYRPRTVRAYGVFVWVLLGVALAMSSTEGKLVLWLAFGPSFMVTMEILSRMSTQLRNAAVTDPLTGIANRNGFEQAAALALAMSRRSGEPLTLVYMDLDDFKQINDEHGHFQGDQLLKSCVNTWVDQLRAGDILARTGGDEFTLLLPGTDAEQAVTMLERLRSTSPHPFSYGLTQVNPGESLPDRLLEADAALLAAKHRRGTSDRLHSEERASDRL